MNPPDRSAISRDADIDDLLGALARADLEQALALLVLIADLRPDMPIAEAFDHVPKARDLVS